MDKWGMESRVEKERIGDTRMNNTEQKKRMILAMEYVARQINDEDVFEGWLVGGVPDGDIEFGCFDTAVIDDDDYFMRDENFKHLMGCFLRRMYGAYKSGGLYCGGLASGDKNDWN